MQKLDKWSGQNKNTDMLTKCHKWLDSHAPENVIEIELMYCSL